MKSEGFEGENEVRTVADDRNGITAKFRATPQGVVRYTRLVSDPTAESSRIAFAQDLGTSQTYR